MYLALHYSPDSFLFRATDELAAAAKATATVSTTTAATAAVSATVSATASSEATATHTVASRRHTKVSAEATHATAGFAASKEVDAVDNVQHRIGVDAVVGSIAAAHGIDGT